MKKFVWVLLFAAAATFACGKSVNHGTAASVLKPNHEAGDGEKARLAPAGGEATTAAKWRDPCSSGHKFAYELTDGIRNIPFPTDLYSVADSTTHTGRRVQLPTNVATYLDPFFRTAVFIKNAISALDGFGTTGAALFSVDVQPDTATLPDGGQYDATNSVFVVEVDPQAQTPVYAPVVFDWEAQFDLFKVRPYLPLLQNKTYAVVITDRVKPLGGACYETADEFQYVRAASADASNPQAAMLEPVRQTLAPMFDFLESKLGVSRQHILSATFYSTQDLTTDLLQMKETLAQRAVQTPPYIQQIEYVGTADGLDSIWDLAYNTVNWRTEGQYGPINYDDNHRPQPTGVEPVLARLTLPSPSQWPQPWPVVVFMHGINADRGSSTTICQTLANYGLACIGIDDVYHGFRGQEFNDVGRDVLFFDGVQPLNWRANWLQDIADQFWLRELIKTLGDLDLSPHATDGDGIADLDLTKVVFLSHSLGSMHGGILAAVDDRYGAFVLNAGAADYRAIAQHSPIGSEIFEVLNVIQNLLHFNIDAWGELLLDTLVIPVEGGDPYAYSPYVLRHRLPELPGPLPQIFHQFAAYDATFGPLAVGRMATSIGLTQLRPIIWQIPDVPDADTPYSSDAAYQWNTDTHGFIYDYETAREQVGEYFRAWADTGTGTINSEPPL